MSEFCSILLNQTDRLSYSRWLVGCYLGGMFICSSLYLHDILPLVFKSTQLALSAFGDYTLSTQCGHYLNTLSSSIGWCQVHNQRLQPPKGYASAGFSWKRYLDATGAVSAPRECFPHTTQKVSGKVVANLASFIECSASTGGP